MDAELPIWRRCFLGKVFEQWHNQVLGIAVTWFSVRVENETNTHAAIESTYVNRAETCTHEEYDWPNTDDGF